MANLIAVTSFVGHSLAATLVLFSLACSDSTSPDAPVLIEPAAQMVQTVQVPRTVQLTTDGGGRGVLWTSSNPRVAIVSNSGLVKTLFPGTTTITARRGSHSDAVSLTAVAARLDVGPNAASVAVHRTAVLRAIARDADGAQLLDVPMRWTSENARIASVDASTGAVQGVTPGVATISVEGGGATASLTVTVTPAERFTLTIDAAGMGNGTVRVADGGINCVIAASATSGACVGTYEWGTTVTLVATPGGAGHAFVSWARGCVGTAATCVVTIYESQTVVATFGKRLEFGRIGADSPSPVYSSSPGAGEHLK